MSALLETQVLIIGAGPVGLTLALDLAQRGVEVLILEKRPYGERPEAKSNHVSARSMEVFRRLGLVQAVREAGLPADYPNDVAYRTTFTGDELSRIPIPARQDRYTATGGPDTWWPTPEPPHRINQTFLEPVLLRHAEAEPNIRLLNLVEAEDVIQDDLGVRVVARDLSQGATLHVRCEYVVGCDGGRSMVRGKIGAKLQGVAVVQRVQSTFLRAPDLMQRAKHAPAWATFSLNPRRSGNVYAIDGRERFVVFNYLQPHETDFEAVDRDWAIRTILGVGEDFRYEVISKEDWIGRRLVADRFRDRRVFICGDAAHLWVPMAGYGMNAGIADAVNLAWLLAGRLRGWIPEVGLRAYEAERLPLTEQVSKFAMDHALAMQKERVAVPDNIEEVGPQGDELRATIGRSLYELNVRQYCCAGLNFGYFYDNSPLIVYDDEKAPAYTMDQFTPSSVPGCRAPHLWLESGRSLYDVLGPGFTVLRLDQEKDVTPILEAAKERDVPVDLVDLNMKEARQYYNADLVIVRSDQHIVWRGSEAPNHAADLIDRIRGAL